MTTKFCRVCKRDKRLSSFTMLFNGHSFFRRKLCDDCFNRVDGAYYERRKRELALIPDPFARKHRPDIELHPLLWTGSV